MTTVKPEVEKFLRKSQNLIGQPETGLAEVKSTLEALGKIDFSLVDPKVLADALASMVENMSRLVDTKRVAVDTQEHVKVLASDMKRLEDKTVKLTQTLQGMKDSFDSLERRLIFDAESQGQRNRKLGIVLEGLEQYLRRHI